MVNLRRLAAQIVGMFLVFALVLFFAAGTIAWPAGWVFLLLFFSFVIALSRWLFKHNPALLTERMTGIGKADQPAWDKFFFALASVMFLAWLVVMPLDAVRFGWSRMPPGFRLVGTGLLLWSFVLFFATFRENTFLSPAVRVQTDRGHTVVSTGPYRHVRHPMYAALIPFIIGTTLLLRSWWGLVPGLLIVVAAARRAVLEERVLRVQLPGYEEYSATVRYRLVPHVW